MVIDKSNIENVKKKLLEQRQKQKELKQNQQQQSSGNSSGVQTESMKEQSSSAQQSVIKKTVIKEKKARQLLTKTDSVSVLITEFEELKKLLKRISNLNQDENFNPSKSDLYRTGLSMLRSFSDEELLELIKDNRKEIE